MPKVKQIPGVRAHGAKSNGAKPEALKTHIYLVKSSERGLSSTAFNWARSQTPVKWLSDLTGHAFICSVPP